MLLVKTPEKQTVTDSAVSEDLDDIAVADFEDPEIYDCESVLSDNDSTQSDNTARIEENDLDSSDSDSSELPVFGELLDPIWDNLYDGSLMTIATASYLLLMLGSKHKLALTAMTAIFTLLKVLLPQPNKLPTFNQARAILLKLSGVTYTTYDLCQKGCIFVS